MGTLRLHILGMDSILTSTSFIHDGAETGVLWTTPSQKKVLAWKSGRTCDVSSQCSVPSDMDTGCFAEACCFFKL